MPKREYKVLVDGPGRNLPRVFIVEAESEEEAKRIAMGKAFGARRAYVDRGGSSWEK